jgi:CBS domain-containing protein
MKHYQNWLKNPSEKSNEMATLFLDFELAYGEQTYEDELTDMIFSYAKSNNLFFDYLGNQTLKKPAALNFFKKFNVEEEGPNKNKFDIKNRGLLPLIDGARLFCMHFGIKGVNNTYARFKQLAIIDPRNAEIYQNCAEAFVVLSKTQTIEGLRFDTNGQFINLEEMSKPDREKLKSALLPMKDLEELIKDAFQLTKFS